MARVFALLGAAYLVGAIPFSFLVARWFGVSDVRRVGSGNVGATNVMRSAGKAAGLLAFALDAAKGAAAALLTERIEPPGSIVPALAAVCAVLGHMYPVWLRFRGGKGVATGAGAFVPLAPAATGIACVVFAVTLAVTRYVSAGSIASAAALVALSFALGSPPAVAWSAAFVTALVIWKHRANLRRLANGTESRVGEPARDKAASP
jgi:acyl phosphate:glycerol-3-phosphate acyltransferase